MNSNVYNQTVQSLNFYIPFVTPASSHFLLQRISSLQNPTSEDFERLFELIRLWIVDVDCSEFHSFSLKTHNPLKIKTTLVFSGRVSNLMLDTLK